MKKQEINLPQIDKSNAIVAKDLTIIFDEKTETEMLVLENFNFTFKKGLIYFIIGNSGSGKTTLVSHFNGLIKTKYGDIFIGDLPIYGAKKKIKNFKKLRKEIGMVFQFPEYQLFKDTIEKDIMFGPVNLGVNKTEAKIRAKKYLNELDLDDSYLPRSPFGLSGGQKRRVAIAGILAIEPNILIFDEPTAGLDPSGEKEMLNIISDLKAKGKTVIVITHVMDQVLALADEVLLLEDKKLMYHGDPYEIFMNNEILQKTKMDLPKVMNVIKHLSATDKKFHKLYNLKPRNVNQLADGIIDIMNKENK